MTISLDRVGRRADTAVPARPGSARTGLALTYLAAATVPWTGARLGPIAFGDVFLVFAAMALVGADLHRPWPRLPGWVWALVVTVVVTAVTNQFAPPSLHYLISRDQLYDNYMVVHTATSTITNLTVMVPLVARLILLPFVFSLARAIEPQALYRAVNAFVAGVAIDAAIAFTDSRGITSIGPSLTGIPVDAQRAAGLTQHPNVVAMTCVFALPLVIWQARSAKGRHRMLVLFALLLILLGLYASRSRSGAAAAAVAGAVALAWLPQYRRFLPTLALLFASLAALLFVANPGSGAALLRGLRLVGGGDTSGSDEARSIVNDQAVRDFLHSPIHGIGLEFAEQAHMVYLQALAVGGVILLAGLVIFLGGALVRCARLARVEPLAIPLFVAVLGGAIFNAAQNALTPAVVYVMEGLVAALPLAAGGRAPIATSTRAGREEDVE